MAKYRGRDVSFEIPNDWHDRTIAAFAAPLKPKQTVAPNFVLTRDIVPQNEPSSTYADKQLVELAKRLEAFNLSDRLETVVGGLPAVDLIFTWRGANGTIKQRQTFVATETGTVLTFVATALVTEFSTMEPTFQAILDSIEFPTHRNGR
jgi:hypothetical protein